jgi:phage terminase large subunit-like protein
MKPEGWARTAVTAAVDWEADCIIVETNFGGDQAVALLVGACEKDGFSIPIRTVTASRGKRPRAEPVSALAVQGRWHHVGYFDQLEDQMCTWTTDANFSPDRIDAMVWPAWHMRLVSTIFRAVGSFGGSVMSKALVGRR